jgi:hypothetical protein
LLPCHAGGRGFESRPSANFSERHCLQRQNVTGQITSGVSVIHAIANKAFDKPTPQY